MGEVICSSCKNTVSTDSIAVCPSCGSMVCGECYKKNVGLCSNCYADMNMLS